MDFNALHRSVSPPLAGFHRQQVNQKEAQVRRNEIASLLNGLLETFVRLSGSKTERKASLRRNLGLAFFLATIAILYFHSDGLHFVLDLFVGTPE